MENNQDSSRFKYADRGQWWKSLSMEKRKWVDRYFYQYEEWKKIKNKDHGGLVWTPSQWEGMWDFFETQNHELANDVHYIKWGPQNEFNPMVLAFESANPYVLLAVLDQWIVHHEKQINNPKGTKENKPSIPSASATSDEMKASIEKVKGVLLKIQEHINPPSFHEMENGSGNKKKPPKAGKNASSLEEKEYHFWKGLNHQDWTELKDFMVSLHGASKLGKDKNEAEKTWMKECSNALINSQSLPIHRMEKGFICLDNRGFEKDFKKEPVYQKKKTASMIENSWNPRRSREIKNQTQILWYKTMVQSLIKSPQDWCLNEDEGGYSVFDLLIESAEKQNLKLWLEVMNEEMSNHATRQEQEAMPNRTMNKEESEGWERKKVIDWMTHMQSRPAWKNAMSEDSIQETLSASHALMEAMVLKEAVLSSGCDASLPKEDLAKKTKIKRL